MLRLVNMHIMHVKNYGVRLPIRPILVQIYSLYHIGGLPHNSMLFPRFLDVMPNTVFTTSFALVLSPPGNAFALSFSFPLQGMLYSYLVLTHYSGRYTCRVLDCPCSLKPDRKSTRLNSSHSGESRMPSSA